jgi:hypothetical protein
LAHGLAIKLIGQCLTLLPACLDAIPFDLLVLLVLVAAASILTMTVSTVVSTNDGLPEHRAKRMHFSLNVPPSADVAAADPAGSPMAVELPFPGEFIDGEFQVVYETL